MNKLIIPMTKEFSEENLRILAYEIIKPEYHKHINDWLFDARPNERKGLFLSGQIIKYKGLKTFQNKLDQAVEDEDLSMENAYKRYQKRAYSSRYQDEFCLTVDQKYKYNNILKFKKFDFVNYSEIMVPKYREYITKWALIEEAEQYKEYILDFARSFFSTVQSNKPHNTMYNNFYQQPKLHDLYNKHGCFMPEVKPKKNLNPTLDELREKFNLDERKRQLDSIKPQYNDQLKNQEEIKAMKQALVNGNRNAFRGVFPDQKVSTYNEYFIERKNKYKNDYKPDFYTSGIKGKIPDPYILKKMQSDREIKSALKSKISNILLK